MTEVPTPMKLPDGFREVDNVVIQTAFKSVELLLNRYDVKEYQVMYHSKWHELHRELVTIEAYNNYHKQVELTRTWIQKVEKFLKTKSKKENT